MATKPSGARVGPVDQFVGNWMRLAHGWPRTALAILAALLVLSGLVIPGISIDADSSKMLSAALPAQQRAAALNEAFPGLKNTIVVIVQAPQADAADLATAALVTQLDTNSKWIDSVFAPAVDPFFAANGFLYQNPDKVGAMFAQLSKSSNLVAGLRTDQSVDGFFGTLDQAAALASRAEIGPAGLDPLFVETASVLEAQNAGGHRTFGWTSLLGQTDKTGNGVMRLITVTPVLDTTRLSPARPALDEIRRAIDTLPPEIAGPVEIGTTGEPALRAEEMQSVFGTMGLSTVLSLLLVAALLRTGLRATGRSVVAFISLVVGIVLTTGFAAVAVGTLNLVSVAFVVLMVGLGVDFAIHILAHIAETRRGGVPPVEAVVLTGTRTGMALALNAATAALAFLAFATTDFTGMAQLGIIGSGGVILAFAVATTLIPAVIAFRPRTAGTVDPRHEPMARVGRRWRALPFVVLAIGVAALYPALHVRFDADPMALRNPSAPSVVAFGKLSESPQTSPYRASVLAGSAEEAAEIAARFKDVPEVAAAVTLQDLIPKHQDEKLMLLDIAAPSIDHAVTGAPTELVSAPGKVPAAERLRRRLADMPGAAGRLSDALAAYDAHRTAATDAALQQDIFRSFPLLIGRLEAMLGADYVTEDSLPAKLRQRFVSPEGIFRVEILPSERLDEPAAIERFVDTVEGIAPDAAGGPMQLVAAGRTVGESMLRATLLAAAATALLAWLATRRLVDTAAVLAPLVVGGVITAAASVLLDMPFNYANVIVLPLMLGLGVASGVHIAIRERRAPGAVFATSTPRAVLFSALTTVAAFGTLSFSEHRGTESMGVLLAVSVVAAVGSVLGLTPALMRWAARITRRLPTPG